MVDISRPKVVNCHHVGLPTKLPSNTVYIGRPSPWGNDYPVSETCLRGQSAALHRIDLYKNFNQNPNQFNQYKHVLDGPDLACWCKQKNRPITCHGDTYLHIFKSPFKDRDYTKPVLTYVRDDVIHALRNLDIWISKEAPPSHYIALSMGLADLKLFLNESHLKSKKDYEEISLLINCLAQVAINLETAIQTTKPDWIDYYITCARYAILNYTHSFMIWTHQPLEPTSKDYKSLQITM